MTIFISVASYQDKLLARTITRAIETAHRPDLLRFGIIDQSNIDNTKQQIKNIASGQIKYVNIPPEQSRGACWARSIAMSLYGGEDWFLQIDSHMDFDQGWDTTLLNRAALLNMDKSVISSYPPAFNFEQDGSVSFNRYDDAVLYTKLVANQVMKYDYPGLQFVADVIVNDKPMLGFHIAAGFLFAKGTFVNKFPYDPWFYFIGEEQSISLRLFTHGWDIYHVPAVPIYHLYNNNDGSRTLHWDKEQDANRQTKWFELDAISRARFSDLCFTQKDLGVYGLGNVRSLKDFANHCSIDYSDRLIRSDCEVNLMYFNKLN